MNAPGLEHIYRAIPILRRSQPCVSTLCHGNEQHKHLRWTKSSLNIVEFGEWRVAKEKRSRSSLFDWTRFILESTPTDKETAEKQQTPLKPRGQRHKFRKRKNSFKKQPSPRRKEIKTPPEASNDQTLDFFNVSYFIIKRELIFELA